MAGRNVRLFVALELPEDVRAALFEWAGLVCGTRPELRQVPGESLHVTLCFLGAVPSERVEAVSRACQVAEEFSAASLAGGEALWLPRRRPRVLTVQLEDPAGLVGSLQGRLGAELARAEAFSPEPRGFLPHVTVARVRGEGPRAGVDAPRARVDAPRARVELPAPPAVHFTAEQVVLYRSHLGGGPARYEALHRVPLSRR